MREEVSKNTFILEVLKDDLDSGKKSIYLDGYKKIIENPDLFSEDENKKRFNLFNKNGAFSGLCLFNKEVKCFVEDFDLSRFLNLKWCPKGNNSFDDGIDIMTRRSRLFKDILEYLKKNNNSNEKVLKTLKDYFYGEIPEDNKRRLFIHKTIIDLQVLDGNHRAGAILLKLSKKNLEEFIPVKIWSLEK